MVRLRDAVMARAGHRRGRLSTFCDECDDFPVPGGPGGYSMMPGTYTGPPMSTAPDAGSGRAATAPASGLALPAPGESVDPGPSAAPTSAPAGDASAPDAPGGTGGPDRDRPRYGRT